jgi:hypothetical protein
MFWAVHLTAVKLNPDKSPRLAMVAQQQFSTK